MVNFKFRLSGFLYFVHILSFVLTFGYDLPWLVRLIFDILFFGGKVQWPLLIFYMCYYDVHLL